MATNTTGQVTYYCFDLMTSTLLAELPFTGVTFSQRLNDAGTFSASLNLRDARTQNLNPLNGTLPGRTLLAIDIDGALVWLGILWTRRYSSSAGVLTVGGSEIWSYFNYRLQANDYTNGPLSSLVPGNGFWPFGGAPIDPQMVAAAVVADVLTAAGQPYTNAGLYGVPATQANVNANYLGTALGWLSIFVGTQSFSLISPSYPISQRQSIQSMFTTLASAGYGVGFDFGIDPSWSGAPGSVPNAQLTISYPIRGRAVGATGLVIDLAQDADYEWDEDATQSLNNVFATASGTGASAGAAGTGLAVGTAIQSQDFTPIADGYPLMEGTQSYTEVNTQDVLQACALGDLGQFEWPVVAPQITLPMFSGGTYPTVGDFIMGDNVRVSMPADDRFPGTPTSPANNASGGATNWSFISAASDVTLSNTATVTATPTPNAGDLLVMSWVGVRGTTRFTGAGVTDNGSSGWKQINPLEGAGTFTAQQCWWKVASAQDSALGASFSVTITGTGGSGTTWTQYVECDVFRLPAGYSVVGLDLAAATVGLTSVTTSSLSPVTGSSYSAMTDALAWTSMCSSLAASNGGVTGSNTFTGATAAANLSVAVTTNQAQLLNQYVGGVTPSTRAFANVWENTWTTSRGPIITGATFVYNYTGPLVPASNGFDTYMRIVAVDYNIPDEGAPTMKLTLNMPLSAAPVPQAPL